MTAFAALSRRLAPWLRIALGQIFILAAWDKILHPAAFADIILNYRMLPGTLVPLAAATLPWVELVLGATLVVGRLVPAAATAGCALLAVFMGALGYNLARGVDVSCGCFSTDPSAAPNALLSLARDGGLLLLGLVVFWQSLGNENAGSREGTGASDEGQAHQG